MAKVSEMLAPGISPAAIDLIHRMRHVMSMDLDEYDMADVVREVNAEINRDQGIFQEAWTLMASNERAAWKGYLELERKEVHVNRY